MTFRNLIKLILGLLIVVAVVLVITSVNHPIILKWLSGTARVVGRPIKATVYTNGIINPGIKVFHVDKYWNSRKKANCYLLALEDADSLGTLRFINIDLNERWIGKAIATSKRDYDFVGGCLLQSETGGHFAPFQHDMKGFGFDPQLSFTAKQINFRTPPKTLKFDIVRIELE